MSKPLLIMPPAPARWAALDALWTPTGARWLADAKRRIVEGVPGAQDACAIVHAGGQCVAAGLLSKQGEVGVVGRIYTQPGQRRRGYARGVTETLLAWFEMTGGKWLHLSATSEQDEALFAKFGFALLHRAVWAPHDRLVMVRRSGGVQGHPLDGARGPVTVRALSRADWPRMVTLLMYREGPDPRVPLAESAVTAEVFAHDLLEHVDKEMCVLFGAFQGERLVGLATVALDQHGPRTYGMVLPHTGAPAELRETVQKLAVERGYEQLVFPMEALAAAGRGGAAPSDESTDRPGAGGTG